MADKRAPELVQMLAAASARPLNAPKLALAPKVRPAQRRVEQLMGLYCRDLPAPVPRAALSIHWSRDAAPAAVFPSEQVFFCSNKF